MSLKYKISTICSPISLGAIHTKKRILYSIGILILPFFVKAQNCNATFDFNIGCNTVSFTPNEIDANLTYSWGFGDGSTSNDISPTHTYDAIGNSTQSFVVSLTVNGMGCTSNTVTRNITVTQVPDVNIQDADEGLNGESLKFVHCESGVLRINNLSSTSATNSSYRIDWGDNTTVYEASTLPNGTSHVYDQPGQYFIEVTVTGRNGCTNKREIPFFYGSNPSVGFGIQSLAARCAPFTVDFPISNIESNVNGTTYEITVNDGSEPVTFNHPPPDTYTHTFDVSSCSTTSTNGNQVFQDAFQITITATNPCGKAASSVVPVRINIPPKADFAISPDFTQCVGDVFDFTNTSNPGIFYSAQSGGCFDLTDVEWQVSPDGGYEITSGSLANTEGFSARFTSPGFYDVTLIVKHKQSSPVCEPDTITKRICVVPIPDAQFSISKNLGCPGLTINTTNQSTTLSSCDTTNYFWEVFFEGSDCGSGGEWSFTDNTDANSINPKFQFDSSGVYRILLTTSNRCGLDTISQIVTVAEAPVLKILPIDTFCISASIMPILEITSGCNDVQSPIYSWQFPGGTPSSTTGESPGIINYVNNTNIPQAYTISVSSTNMCGTTSTTETFNIFPSPDIPNITSNSPICTDDELRFNLTNANGLGFEWEGPNDFTSNLQNPIIPDATPVASGNYKLIVADLISGCTSDTSINAIVFDLPPVRISPEQPEVCIGQSITLNATGANTYTWQPAKDLNAITGPTVVFTPSEVENMTYIVTGTVSNNGKNCINRDTVEVIVNDLPEVSAGQPLIVCAGTDQQLLGTPEDGDGGMGYWTGPNVTPSGVFNGCISKFR